jgi:hypothetical protein
VTTGRTIWQAQDCAWWTRERVTELGEEFGPAGPAVANWLECQAKLQNSGGKVKAGYRAIARGAFLEDGADQAERIVRFAVAIEFLTGFEEGSRTFVATVAAFKSDQSRGRDTITKGDRRTGEPTVASEESPRTTPDNPGQGPTCPTSPRERRGEERTEETNNKAASQPVEPARLDDARQRLQAATVTRIFEYWQTTCGHPDAKLLNDRRRKVQARLKEGYTEQQIRSAIDGAAAGAYVNDDGKRFDDLELICRSSAKLEDFIGRSPGNNTPNAAAGGYTRND